MWKAVAYRMVLCGAVGLFGAPTAGLTETPPTAEDAESPAGAADDTGSVPRIRFAALEHDFGQAISGRVLKTTFHFRNAGDGVLVIEKVKGG